MDFCCLSSRPDNLLIAAYQSLSNHFNCSPPEPRELRCMPQFGFLFINAWGKLHFFLIQQGQAMMDDKLNWSRALEELQTKTKERHGFFFLFLIFLPYLRLLVQYDDDRWKSKATIKSGSWRWVLSAGTSHWLKQKARRWNELLLNQTQILLKKSIK